MILSEKSTENQQRETLAAIASTLAALTEAHAAAMNLRSPCTAARATDQLRLVGDILNAVREMVEGAQ